MEDFVPFDLAVKLREKGFSCEYPFAIYDEDGEFFTLYSSDKYYFEIENFDDRDFIAPTISQVLKWLRDEKKIHIEPCILTECETDADGKVINEFTYWSFRIVSIVTGDMIYFEYKHIDDMRFDSYEQAAIAGIEYALDNLSMDENFEEKVINEMVDVMRNDKNFQEFSKQTMNKIILGEL